MQGERIFSSGSEPLHVALAFNVKPEAHAFSSSVPPAQPLSQEHQPEGIDVYAEWDTWETIHAVEAALTAYNRVTLVEAGEDAFAALRGLRPDIVFNIAECMNGASREAQIPAMLDMLKIPYTGSDPLTLGICLDKGRTKEILSYHSIPTAKFAVASRPDDIDGILLRYPLMVKPNAEGSSKGIFSSSVVRDKNELRREVERVTAGYHQEALIEEFLTGREFTVAMLGNGPDTRVLPIVEINYGDFPEGMVPIYSFEAKWIFDTRENPLDVFSCPAEISSSLRLAIEQTCLRTYSVLRCRDWSRIDVRLDADGMPNIIEINPLPGILPKPEDNSCYPKAARTAGMDYTQMLNSVLYAACARYGLV